jgi:hypothetical protein
MGFLSGIYKGLFGGAAGGGKSNEADWDQIMKLMEMSADLNRYAQHGLFTNVDWAENPDGTWTQSQSVNPALQAGVDNLMAQMSSPISNYESPAQFSQMLDAKMANQMGRQGILEQGAQQPVTPFGQPSAQRPGLQPNPFTTGPPQGAAAMLPPGAGQPQQGPPQQGMSEWDALQAQQG